MQDLGLDMYGRTVKVVRGTDLDTYSVYEVDSLMFYIQLPADESDLKAFKIINNMAPG